MEDSAVSLDADILNKPEAAHSARLRPYRQRRTVKKFDPTMRRIAGGMIGAAWPYFVGFMLYATAACFICKYTTINTVLPMLFNLSGEFMTIGTAFFAFILVGWSTGSGGRYGVKVQAYYDFMDAVGTASLYTVGATDRDKLVTLLNVTEYGPDGKPVLKQKQAVKVYEEIQALWRAAAFAFKHNFRTQPTKPRGGQLVKANLDYKKAGVKTALLPMPYHLIYELNTVPGDIIGGILLMLTMRYRILDQELVFRTGVLTVQAHVNNVGTQAALMTGYQTIPGVGGYHADMMYFGIWLWAIFVIFSLYDQYEFYALIPYALYVLFNTGLSEFGKRIGDPYNRVDSSLFIYHDLGGNARSLAKATDQMFDKSIREAQVVLAGKIVGGAAASEGDSLDEAADDGLDGVVDEVDGVQGSVLDYLGMSSRATPGYQQSRSRARKGGYAVLNDFA